MIGISLLTFASGRLGGSETYARGLLASLREHGALDYVVALPPDEVDAAAGLPVRAAGATSSRSRPVALARAAGAAGALAGADLVHYPLTIALPRTSAPSVVTLHDTLHLDLPALVPRATRLFRRVMYDAAVKRADRVIVPSAFVRDRAVHLLGLNPECVRVVHHAVDTELFRPDDGEREPFLLYPARAWPHKNHALLFAAFARVRADRPDLELVLTGGGHDFTALPAGVRSLGSVDVRQLADLYRRASALVFPSLYEGFGLPVLEAMASGCPVVAVENGAVEEVADGGVAFAEPRPDALAAEILALLNRESGGGGAFASRRIAIARSYTWKRVAEQHEAVYAELF